MMTRGEQSDYMVQLLNGLPEVQKNDASVKAQFASFPNDALFYQWAKDLKDQYLANPPAALSAPAALAAPEPTDTGEIAGYFLTNQSN